MLIGVDPGLSGALAIFDPDGSIQIHDMPTFFVGANTRRRVDLGGLIGLLSPMGGGAIVGVEDNNPRPGNSAQATFGFALATGELRGVVAALGNSILSVRPQVWKKALAVPKGKDGSIMKCAELFPEAMYQIGRNHNRADALLIAHYTRLVSVG
jgi:crossover junction endodeoxyribonuclease RuvC